MLKESYPVEVAEFAMAHGLESQPAFNWWVKPVLKQREAIILAVKNRKSQHAKKQFKFGIALPKSVAEALQLDKESGNTLWADAISKEITAIKPAFKILQEHEKVPPGYLWVPCHIIFDVKVEDLRRKARFVAGGHVTGTPSVITYAGVVSRDTVRICLIIASLNDITVLVADIENAYITAPNMEHIWTTLGPEFGTDAGKRALIVRALYGLKSSGAAFRFHLRDCMKHLGYISCLADQDLWFKAETRASDGVKYYAYILLYVDGILVIHHDAEAVLLRIDKYFKLKAGSSNHLITT